jgi:hypothetical protein
MGSQLLIGCAIVPEAELIANHLITQAHRVEKVKH